MDPFIGGTYETVLNCEALRHKNPVSHMYTWRHIFLSELGQAMACRLFRDAKTFPEPTLTYCL